MKEHIKCWHIKKSMLFSLKENETQHFTWWYVTRTSKSTFCTNVHIGRPQNSWVLLICERKYRLLQNVNSIYSESPFCLKIRHSPRRDDEIGLNVLDCMNVYAIMAYTFMQSRGIWLYCPIVTECPLRKNEPCFIICVKFSCKEHARNDKTKSNRTI